MKLSRTFDKLLAAFAVIFGFLLIGIAVFSTKTTYAGNETGVYEAREEHFVTFYDDGQKLIVRTNAETVGEALERAGYVINDTDIVEPALEEKINSDNFYINIHRAHPAVIKINATMKYVMTASYDPKVVAEQAGFTVYDGDEINLIPNDNFLEMGVATVYELIRNGGREVTVETEIPYEETRIKDYNLAPGQEEVRQLGEVGTMASVYEVWYVDGVETKRELKSETVKREPVERIVAVGASAIEMNPLTPSKGRNRYTVTVNGSVIERQETYYDLPMSGVMGYCGGGSYSVRADGAKVDSEGYVLVAANLSRYPRCSVVETSLGLGKVYDTGGFAAVNPEQFDLATDWSNRDGR
ncbi:G5 domain-containing protein [Candidatus Saccharibacteria bacterium]|nr:G5 domain-containing protein [Candidatus Saccharibacteria bacterium]